MGNLELHVLHFRGTLRQIIVNEQPMKRLIDPNKNPPNMRFVDPDTGFVYEQAYKSINELLAHVRKYRSANNKDPIPALRLRVEDYICQQPGSERHCRNYNENERHLTVREWRRGGEAFIRSKIMALTKGDDARFVDESQAVKRAQVCLRCPFNMKFQSRGQLEHHADQLQIRDLGDRAVPAELEAKLDNCSVCGCNLKTKVWYSREIIDMANADLNEQEKEDMPDSSKKNIKSKDGNFFDCWMLKEPT